MSFTLGSLFRKKESPGVNPVTGIPQGTFTIKEGVLPKKTPEEIKAMMNKLRAKGKGKAGGTRRKRPTPYNLRAANELFRRSPQVAANNIKLLTKSRNKRMLRQLRKLSNTTRRR